MQQEQQQELDKRKEAEREAKASVAVAVAQDIGFARDRRPFSDWGSNGLRGERGGHTATMQLFEYTNCR